MLVLSRKANESIVIDGHTRVRVLGVQGGTVRLGIEAPREVSVHREELWRELCKPTAPERRLERVAR